MRIARLLAATSLAALALTVVLAATTTKLAAQGRGSDPPHTLDLTWDRWLDHDEVGERMQLMART